jgi:F-type H+-transporting ATPase subunit gamma
VAEKVREINARIGNIENIRQITKAMNAIAMTKVTRMKRRLAAVQPYIDGLENVLSSVVGQYPELASSHPLVANNESNKLGILVLNSDRGLCGRFKGELNHKAETLASEQQGSAQLLLGGDKARSYFSRRRVNVLKTYIHTYEKPTVGIANNISSDLISLYKQGAYGRLVVVYMHFVSDLVQRLRVEQILPIVGQPKKGDTLVEPNPGRMLDVVFPLYLRGKIFQALLDTKTSEDAIRRQAMTNATNNADDLLTNLRRSYNKARQQSITLELSDIMGGAEALRG